MQEIKNRAGLPLVLTYPPEEVQRLDLCRRWLIYPFYIFQCNMCLNYTCILFFFFNFRLHGFHLQFCCFHIGRGSARNYRAFEKIDILFYEHHVQTHIYFNFGVNSFINKEIVSFVQLHTHKFGLVYNGKSEN